MMVYFDTNVDDEKQKNISVKLVENGLALDTVIVSELTLCEFAFISNKINENKHNIDDNLEFLSTFLQPSNLIINQRVIDILKDTSLYISSFDICHLAFAEYYNSKLFTFDKGFKKLQNISKVEVIIK